MRAFFFRFCAAAFAFAFCIAMCLPVYASEPQFDTPEAVIEAFVVAIAQNDYDAAIALFDAERVSREYDWEAMVSRIRTYSANFEFPAPDSIPAFQPLNRRVWEGRIATLLYRFSASFFLTDGLLGDHYTQVDEAWLSTYAERIDPAQLKNLRIVRIGDPRPADADDEWRERVNQMLIGQAKPYGADEKLEKLVMYELDDKHFVGAFSLLRYGDAWVLHSLYSSIMPMGLSVSGVVSTIPVEEAWEYVADKLEEGGGELFLPRGR